VGAIERASTLVHHELGWPTGGDAVAGLVEAVRADEFTARTDPASPSEVEVPLARPVFALLEAFAPADGVDLTAVTRAADRTAPGSPANALETAVGSSVKLFESALGAGTGTASRDGHDGE
jgi:hypothetical protein